MTWGGWDWVGASSVSQKVLGLGLGGPYGVVGPSSFHNDRNGVVRPFGGLSGTLKCRGHILRWPVTFDACCCTN